ncbi:MAG: hypothetical protein GEV28_28520 [Actinophytocola sp.]|uniref:DUF5667 domain-containing protein n=1 Tax=Actinophytocola sp. TaxID=1872138 RepID=UPI001329362B|nr:DUF5667 domain-containing protein [Actinophytocola sp.]MPZ84129.1 hypothetical protein [Actinophytocola sp.]
MESGPDREDAEHDRTVVPAMAWLAPLTAPTGAERDRIRERILAGLPEAPAAGAGTTRAAGAATVTTDLMRRPRPVAPGRTARARRGPRGPKGRADRSDRPDREPARPMSGARARFAIAAVAVLALIGSLTGMSLLLARDALPGDALYGVKRTAEAASLGLTFGDEPQALKHLEFAGARVGEIETLARRYPDRDSAPVGGYLTALTDFDNDAAAGSRQLIALATRADGRQLDALRSWAQQQDARLTEVTPRLPAAARNRETATLALLDKIATRAGALFARMDCYQITSGSFDDVGALPATGACGDATGADPNAPSSSVPGDTDSSVQPTVPPQGAEPSTSGQPTPALPPLPPVARTVPQPAPPGSDPSPGAEQPPGDGSTIVLPLPLPAIELPPLLPGLPGVRIGQ